LGLLLGHVDLDDNDGSADSHLAPGEGTINFAPFVAALERVGYTGYLSVELGMQYVLDPDPVVASCLEWMRRTFAVS
jgi:sugar phosphate isomerase/epimerase